jgi:hypothetical protein
MGAAPLTLVLKEVAHPCPPGEDKLRDILHNLGLILGRERSKPFRQPLRVYVSWLKLVMSSATTNHFALARKKDEVAANPQLATAANGARGEGIPYVMAMMKAFLQRRQGRLLGRSWECLAVVFGC